MAMQVVKDTQKGDPVLLELCCQPCLHIAHSLKQYLVVVKSDI